MLIGQGAEVQEAIKQVGMVVERISAIPATMKLLERYEVDILIITAVDAVVNKGTDSAETVGQLMVGEKRNEISKLVFSFRP